MLLSNTGKSERYNMASRYLLNRYQRTLRPKAKTLLDRVKIESRLNEEMHEANMEMIGNVSSLAMKGGETLRDYKLAKAGGYEDGLFTFMGNPEQAGEFKAKGADLAKIYGRESVLGGETFIRKDGGIVHGERFEGFGDKTVSAPEAPHVGVAYGRPEMMDDMGVDNLKMENQNDVPSQHRFGGVNSSFGGVNSIGDWLMRRKQSLLGSY